MSEKKAEKVKGFRLSLEEIKLLNDLIASSGRDPDNESSDWFRDLIHKLSTQELVLEKDGISPSLKKHFSSDIMALKDATNAITTTFINQMNRMAVEKGNWDRDLQKTKIQYEEKLTKNNEHIKELEHSIVSLDQEIESANNHNIQLQNKIDGFDKLEEQLRKDIERLELDKVKHEQDLQRLREENTADKERYQKEIEEIRNDHKEEKERLNQQIVDLVNKLRAAEPVQKENSELKDKVRILETKIKDDNRQYEIDLTRQQEQAELEKEKSLLTRERELREQLHAQYREDTKELYEKIERLQTEVNTLHLENNQLKGRQM